MMTHQFIEINSLFKMWAFDACHVAFVALQGGRQMGQLTRQTTGTGTTMSNPPPIPGTTLFDGAQARKGYALNKMCFSFN